MTLKFQTLLYVQKNSTHFFATMTNWSISQLCSFLALILLCPICIKWSICVSHEINCKWRKNQSNQFEASKKFCFSTIFRLCHFSIIFRFFIQVACYLLLFCAFFCETAGCWVLSVILFFIYHLNSVASHQFIIQMFFFCYLFSITFHFPTEKLCIFPISIL